MGRGEEVGLVTFFCLIINSSFGSLWTSWPWLSSHPSRSHGLRVVILPHAVHVAPSLLEDSRSAVRRKIETLCVMSLTIHQQLMHCRQWVAVVHCIEVMGWSLDGVSLLPPPSPSLPHFSWFARWGNVGPWLGPGPWSWSGRAPAVSRRGWILLINQF